MPACIYTNVLKHLSESEAKILTGMFDVHTAKIESAYPNAEFTAAQQIQMYKQATLGAVAEYVHNSLPEQGEIQEDTDLLEAVAELTIQYLPPIIVTQRNINHALVWLDNVVLSSLSSDKKAFINKTKAAVKSVYLSPDSAGVQAINKVWLAIVDGVSTQHRNTKPQLGKVVDSATTTLAEELLQNSLTYNTPLVGDKTKTTERDSLATALESKETSPQSLLQAIPNLMRKLFPQGKYLGKPENTTEIVTSILEDIEDSDTNYDTLLQAMDTKVKESFTNYARFNTKLSLILVGTPTNPGILDFLYKNTIYKSNLEGNLGLEVPIAGNPIGHLIQVSPLGEKTFNENVTTAMTAVAFTWLGTQASATIYNKEETTNRILGHSPSTVLSPKAYLEFQHKGMPQILLAETLGKNVFSLLGLTTKKTGVDGNYQSKLELAIGQTIVMGMVHGGLLTQESVPADVINKYHKSESSVLDSKRHTNFNRVVTIIGKDGYSVPITSIQKIIMDVPKVKDTFEKLFGIESRTTTPQFSIPGPTVRKIKNDFIMRAPTKLNEAIDALDQVSFEVKQNVAGVFTALPLEMKKELLGYTPDVSSFHSTEDFAIEGKNRTILRETETLEEFLLEANTNKFYFTHNVVNNTRVMIQSDTLNPETSKLHRHLVSTSSAAIQVSTETERNFFKTAVVSAFGTDIGSVPLNIVTQEFTEILTDPKIQLAVQAARLLKSASGLKEAQIVQLQQTIIDVVKTAKDPIHAFDALINLVDYSATIPFSTNLAVETDGKTNGVPLAVLQNAHEKDAVHKLALSGVYAGTSLTNLTDSTDQDNYEALVVEWVANMAKSGATGIESVFLVEVLGELTEWSEGGTDAVTGTGRKFGKGTLMPGALYGASDERIQTGIAETALKNFYTLLMATKNTADPVASATALMDRFNEFTGADIKISDYVDLRNEVLPNKEKELFLSKVKALAGVPMSNALNSQFPEIKYTRETINLAAKFLFHIFDVHLQKALKKKVQINKGLPLTKTEIRETVVELIDVVPAVRTFFSNKKDEASYTSAPNDVVIDPVVNDKLLLLGTSSERDYTNTAQKIQVGFSVPIRNSAGDYKSVLGQISTPTFTDTGISTFPRLIQSIDSAVAASVYKDTPMLNLFDAGLYSLNDVLEGTQVANKAISDISKEYNIVTEIRTSLEEALQSIESDKELLTALDQALLDDVHTQLTPTYRMVDLLKEIEEAHRASKDTLEVSDYVVANVSLPNGEYVPSFSGSLLSPVNSTIESATDAAIKEALDSEYGTTNEASIDFSTFEVGNTQILSAQETTKIFKELASLGNVRDTPKHTRDLKGVLDALVTSTFKAFDKAKLKYDLRIEQNGDMTFGGVKGKKVHITVAETNTVPSSTQGMSAQETYVHELIHTVTGTVLDNSTFTKGQITKLFEEVKNQVTIEHFLPSGITTSNINKTSIEYIEAKKRYEYIFENASGNSIEEFIAFGVTNQKFISILVGIKTNSKSGMKGMTLWEKVQEGFERILTWINQRIRGMGKDPTADKALLILTKELVKKNHENNKSIFRHLDAVNRLNTSALSVLNNKILTPLQNYRKVLRDKENKNLPERVVRTILGLPEITKTTVHSDIVRQVMRAIKVTEKTIMVALARELIGSTERRGGYDKLLRLSNKTVDQARKQVADSVHKDLLAHYSTELTKEEKIAVTKGLLKPDTSILFDVMSVDEVTSLLEDDAALLAEINRQENTITRLAPSVHNIYKIQADNLGYFLATGDPKEEGLGLNAHNIANMFTSGGISTAPTKETIKQLDVLVTLYALQYTKTTYKQTLASVIKREYNDNPDGTGMDMNGIANTLSNINGFKAESLKHLFDNNPVLVTKGYTHETYNPNISLQIDTIKNRSIMEDAGYTVVGTLERADIDPTKEDLVLYKSRTDGTRTRVKTIASITNKVARGTSLIEAALAADSKATKVGGVISVHKAKQALTVAAGRHNKGIRSTKKKAFMVPTLNGVGNVVDFRYMMSEEVKDKELEKLNDFAAILGSARGSVVDKTNSKIINRELLLLMKADYDEHYEKNRSSFVRIGANVRDPELREVYSLLPKDMLKDMEEIWGKDGIYIKEEFVKLAFGFRKLTIINAPGMATALDTKIAKKIGARSKILYTEKLWTDFVGIAKDMIVVKSVVVLKDNVISNAVLLWIKGVPFKDTFLNQARALSALNTYQKLIGDRSRLVRKLEEAPNLSTKDKQVLTVKIANLTTSIDTNIVKELVDEGLFQSIMEDLDVQDNTYSFKSMLEERIEPYVEKYVPDVVSWTVKQALMTHDTFVYKTLFKATQYSDFIARYTLYQHLINNKGVTKNEALVDVIDTFINYDVPTSPELQWLNDTGFIMFTKFALRIQKIILKSFIKHPVNAVTVEAFGISPTISDSFLTPDSFIGKFQNPIIAIPDTAINLGGLDIVTGGAI